MGLKYRRGDLDAKTRALAQASSEFKGMIAAEMESIKPPIQAAMVAYSDMRKNRISGDMVDAMDVEVSKTATQLRFGFLRGVQDYFRFQTITGFRHWKSGEFIEPSLALSDAKLDAQELMDEAAVRIRRNFMQRIRRR